MADDTAIKVESVSKTFKLPHERHTSVKSTFVNFYKQGKGYEKQEVLTDVTFEIKKGDFFGIVGRNGNGKSTLLKLMAGIYTPDTGTININGRLTPFIELGVGFNPELSGRENVYLNGALLGFSRKEMDAMYDDIVAFAEIEPFMDQKLKNYSSGMQVRLAFSIAIRAESDVLLIDEVLAVGDISFQRKCYEHFVSLKKQGKTVVLVTHDMSAVERFCTKAIVIDKGKVSDVMTPRKAAKIYNNLNASHSDATGQGKSNRWGTKEVTIEEVAMKQAQKNKGVYTVNHGEEATIDFKISPNSSINKIVLGLAIYNEFGINVSGPNSITCNLSPGHMVEFTIPKMSLNPGRYEVTAILFDEEVITEFDHIEKCLVFDVEADEQQKHGVVNLFGEWRQYEKN